MADASLFVINLNRAIYQKQINPRLSHLNVGTGVDVTIKELAETIKEIVGFKGKISFDQSKPDGTLRKLLDVTVLSKLGWRATTSLKTGLNASYRDYVSNYSYQRK